MARRLLKRGTLDQYDMFSHLLLAYTQAIAVPAMRPDCSWCTSLAAVPQEAFS